MNENSKTRMTRVDLSALLPQEQPETPPPKQGAQFIAVLYSAEKQVFYFNAGEEVRVGRKSQSEIQWCNFDLSGYDAQRRSVSRRHCLIYSVDGIYYVRDLSSSNGTWQNGKRLKPGEDYTLSSRDYVQVGDVGFWVFPPAKS